MGEDRRRRRLRELVDIGSSLGGSGCERYLIPGVSSGAIGVSVSREQYNRGVRVTWAVKE